MDSTQAGQTGIRTDDMSELEREWMEWQAYIAPVAEYEELRERQAREAAFAKAAGWQYDRYWETMTLEELRAVQS